MTRATMLLLVAVLEMGCASSGIEHLIAVRALRPPDSMICTDGAPVRIVTDASCRYGVCGWTCAPGRWQP